MATRSGIGIMKADGTIDAIYCHNDGYLEGVGAVLAEHYNNEEKINKLLDLGDISGLGSELEYPEDADLGDPVVDDEMTIMMKRAQYSDVTVAYHRDMGERMSSVKKSTYNNEEAFTTAFDSMGAEYCYLFKDNEWYVSTFDDFFNEWHLLSNKLGGGNG